MTVVGTNYIFDETSRLT